MNITLFQDLCTLVNIEAPHYYIEDETFFRFLIGDSETTPYSTAIIKQCICEEKSLRSVFKNNYRNILESSIKLHLQDIFKYKSSTSSAINAKIQTAILSKKSDIHKIYTKHNITLPQNTDTEQQLLTLFSLCIYEPTTQLFASYKNQQLKPSTLDSTLGRKNDAERLRFALDHHHKILVSDEFGTGKSRFIQYCLSTWRLEDYYYINYCYNLKSTLSQIKYADVFKNIYSNNVIVAQTFSSSLLIIDNMYYSPNIEEDLKQLETLNINVIAITTNRVNSGSFHNFELSPLSDDTLLRIYENTTGFQLLDDKILKDKLLSTTCKNVLLISLIAGQCKNILKDSTNKCSPADTLEQIISNLSILNSHLNQEPTINYKFKHPYTKKTLDLLGHIKSAYTNFLDIKKDELQKCMKYLCFFGHSPISLNFIAAILPAYNLNDIVTLSTFGLISMTEENIQLSPLITHAVFAAKNPDKFKLDELVKNLSIFLENYDRDLSVPYLSDSLLIFAQTLYDHVDYKNNPTQKKTSQKFEAWQELMYLISNYYNQTENSELARKMTELIKYPDNLKNAHSHLDKLIFTIENNMLTETTYRETIDSLDKILDVIALDDTNEIINAELTTLCVNVLDTIISVYCINLFESGTTIVNINYSNSMLLMTKIVQFILHPKFGKPIKISSCKKVFYLYCHGAITQDPHFNSHFEDYKNRFNCHESINFELRFIAFNLIFENSIFISYSSNWYEYEKEDSMNSIIKKMHILNELVEKCALIPTPTFRLCLYAFLFSTTSHTSFIAFNNSKKKLLTISDIANFESLFNRCTLNKDSRDKALSTIESTFKKINNTRIDP